MNRELATDAARQESIRYSQYTWYVAKEAGSADFQVVVSRCLQMKLDLGILERPVARYADGKEVPITEEFA